MIEIPPPPLHYREPIFVGKLRLASRFNLAPLAGYTNLPFRLSIRELGGAGLCTTDLVNARAILENIKKTMDLLATVPGERPLAVQIFGSKPGEMAAAARWLIDRRLADSIDINMGCPVRKVVQDRRRLVADVRHDRNHGRTGAASGRSGSGSRDCQDAARLGRRATFGPALRSRVREDRRRRRNDPRPHARTGLRRRRQSRRHSPRCRCGARHSRLRQRRRPQSSPTPPA